MKTLGYIIVLDLVVLLILSVLRILNLIAVVLVYEALFITIVGVFQILCTYIYRVNRDPSSYVDSYAQARTGWFDYRKFAKLTPEERQRYRQEGKAMIIIGLVIGVASIIVHLSKAS